MNEYQKLGNILIWTPFTLNVVAHLASNWPSSSPTSSIYNRIRGCWTLVPTEAYQTCFPAKEFGVFVIGIDPWDDRTGDYPHIDYLTQNARSWGVEDRVLRIKGGCSVHGIRRCIF